MVLQPNTLKPTKNYRKLPDRRYKKINMVCFSMVYTLFGSWQLSGNYRITEKNFRKKLPDLPDTKNKTIENELFILKTICRLLPD
jgi:hypothetical protein